MKATLLKEPRCNHSVRRSSLLGVFEVLRSFSWKASATSTSGLEMSLILFKLSSISIHSLTNEKIAYTYIVVVIYSNIWKVKRGCLGAKKRPLGKSRHSVSFNRSREATSEILCLIATLYELDSGKIRYDITTG